MEKLNRISRDELLMGVVHLLSKRSTCVRGHNAALISKDGRIVSTGYNNPPKGQPHCSPDHCDINYACIRSVHAEANAIAFSARFGIPLEGTTMYVSSSPCKKCAELIIQAGIKEVIYRDEFRDDEGLNLLKQSGILVRKYESEVSND